MSSWDARQPDRWDEDEEDSSSAAAAAPQPPQQQHQADAEEEDDEPASCPLCMEELVSAERAAHGRNLAAKIVSLTRCVCCVCAAQDLTDLSFHPCKCGYQICLWCYHQMLDNEIEAKCPACRAPFVKGVDGALTAPTAVLAAAHAHAMVAQNTQRAAIKKKSANAHKERQVVAAPGPNKGDMSATLVPIEGAGMTPLSEVRVVQRNLAYVVGLSSACGREDLLRKREWFGGFGKSIKISVSKSFGAGGGPPTFACYITYVAKSDAADAIKAVNFGSLGIVLAKGGHGAGGHADHEPPRARASFGTTKYCAAWLKGQPCTKSNCLYLHSMAPLTDCVTDDHQLLTERGWMFLDEVLAFQDSQPKSALNVASLNEDTQALEYHPLSDVIVRDGTHSVIDFVHPKRALSLTVTRQHDMYARTGMNTPAGSIRWQRRHPTQKQQLFRKTSAESLLQSDPHSRVQLLAHAPNGFAPASSAALPLQRALALSSDAELSAALELLGSWIGAGSKGEHTPAGLTALHLPASQLQQRERQRLLLQSLQLQEGTDFCVQPHAILLHHSRWVSACLTDSAAFLSSLHAQLAQSHCRALLQGAQLACGVSTEDQHELTVATALVRDALLLTCFHAGYSAHFEQTPSLGDKQPLWRVCYSESAEALQPTLSAADCASERSYEGRVWCVDVPPHHLIVYRRAVVDPQSLEVTSVSRALVIGNCCTKDQLQRDRFDERFGVGKKTTAHSNGAVTSASTMAVGAQPELMRSVSTPSQAHATYSSASVPVTLSIPMPQPKAMSFASVAQQSQTPVANASSQAQEHTAASPNVEDFPPLSGPSPSMQQRAKQQERNDSPAPIATTPPQISPAKQQPVIPTPAPVVAAPAPVVSALPTLADATPPPPSVDHSRALDALFSRAPHPIVSLQAVPQQMPAIKTIRPPPGFGGGEKLAARSVGLPPGFGSQAAAMPAPSSSFLAQLAAGFPGLHTEHSAGGGAGNASSAISTGLPSWESRQQPTAAAVNPDLSSLWTPYSEASNAPAANAPLHSSFASSAAVVDEDRWDLNSKFGDQMSLGNSSGGNNHELQQQNFGGQHGFQQQSSLNWQQQQSSHLPQPPPGMVARIPAPSMPAFSAQWNPQAQSLQQPQQQHHQSEHSAFHPHQQQQQSHSHPSSHTPPTLSNAGTPLDSPLKQRATGSRSRYDFAAAQEEQQQQQNLAALDRERQLQLQAHFAAQPVGMRPWHEMDVQAPPPQQRFPSHPESSLSSGGRFAQSNAHFAQFQQESNEIGNSFRGYPNASFQDQQQQQQQQQHHQRQHQQQQHPQHMHPSQLGAHPPGHAPPLPHRRPPMSNHMPLFRQ